MKEGDILKNLFLSQFENCSFGRAQSELNGLQSNSVPENCDIIDKFTNKDRDRTFYLLHTMEYACLLRVCIAMHGSGYDEFAVLHEYGDRGNSSHIDDKFYRWKASV